jgi:hypothetical protein
MTPDLVLIVYLDGTWRIEPAHPDDGCGEQGDDYHILTIPVGELMTAIEAARTKAATPKPQWE